MEETAQTVIERLKVLSTKNPSDVAKTRLVSAEHIIGVSTRDIRKLAKQMGKDVTLAEELWHSTFLEAQALAILITPPSSVDEELISRWVFDIQDWSTCDLFVKTLVANRTDALKLSANWVVNSGLYIKRAGLALIANFCMRAKYFDDETSIQIKEIIEATSSDNRDHVRQACCWALREFGKSNAESHEDACVLALELSENEQASKRWVGRCAYRELENLVKVPERRRLISRHSKTGAMRIDSDD